MSRAAGSWGTTLSAETTPVPSRTILTPIPALGMRVLEGIRMLPDGGREE